MFAGRYELGRKQAFDGFAITLYAAVQIAEVRQQSYAERSDTAAGTKGELGLTYQSHQVSSLQTFLGAQFDTHQVLANGKL